MATSAEPRPERRADEGLLVNALIGAVVSVVLAFVPLSPVLGGGVAGYLQKGDDRTGLKVGAVSGAIASVPVLAILVLLFGFLSVVTVVPDGAGPGVPLAFALFGLVAAAFVLLFVVGLSAIGGLVGAAIARERGQPPTASAPVRTAGEREETPADADSRNE